MSDTLPASDVALLAYQVGVPQGELVHCVAIAMAESGLAVHAVGYNGPTPGCPNGSRDRGLWQINDCYHSDISDACAFDAGCNAKAMAKISNGGTNWTPWSTWNSGAWLGFQAAASKAVSLIGQGTAQLSGGSVPYDPVADLKQAIDRGGNPFQATFNVIGHVFQNALRQAGF